MCTKDECLACDKGYNINRGCYYSISKKCYPNCGDCVFKDQPKNEPICNKCLSGLDIETKCENSVKFMTCKEDKCCHINENCISCENVVCKACNIGYDLSSDCTDLKENYSYDCDEINYNCDFCYTFVR